jgi:hypothetical protein
VNSHFECEADAIAMATHRWSEPSPYFSSGQDQRSSDNAILAALYGGLYKSTLHNFQNAGRVLLDRTDLRILFESYRYELPVRPLDQVSRHLDTFVRKQVFPLWGRLHLVNTKHEASAAKWSEIMAAECFGDSSYRQQARCLLFFLCPMLPIVLGQGDLNDLIGAPKKLPLVQSSDEVIRAELQRILESTDWWSRRILWQRDISSGAG